MSAKFCEISGTGPSGGFPPSGLGGGKPPTPCLRANNPASGTSPGTRAVVRGGVGAVHLQAQRLGIVRDIDDGLHLANRHPPYIESDHVLDVAENFLAGGKRLGHLDALGAERVADPTTAGDFCRRFTEAGVGQWTAVINRSRLRARVSSPASSSTRRSPAPPGARPARPSRRPGPPPRPGVTAARGGAGRPPAATPAGPIAAPVWPPRPPGRSGIAVPLADRPSGRRTTHRAGPPAPQGAEVTRRLDGHPGEGNGDPTEPHPKGSGGFVPDGKSVALCPNDRGGVTFPFAGGSSKIPPFFRPRISTTRRVAAASKRRHAP